MAIATRRTASEGVLVETHWRTGRLVRGTRSGGRAAIWAAIIAAELAVVEESVVLEVLVALAVWETAAGSVVPEVLVALAESVAAEESGEQAVLVVLAESATAVEQG